jgi:hypothetical protein
LSSTTLKDDITHLTDRHQTMSTINTSPRWRHNPEGHLSHCPIYGVDDRKDYSYEKLKPLIPLERLANDYKKKRNIAFAMQGDCLIKTGDNKSAIPVLLKALDLIHIDNDVWWERTRNNLLKVIEVSAD